MSLEVCDRAIGVGNLADNYVNMRGPHMERQQTPFPKGADFLYGF